MVHIVAFANKFIVKIIFKIFIKLFIQEGSRLSQVMVSLRIKFETVFRFVELKTET